MFCLDVRPWEGFVQLGPSLFLLAFFTFMKAAVLYTKEGILRAMQTAHCQEKNTESDQRVPRHVVVQLAVSCLFSLHSKPEYTQIKT